MTDKSAAAVREFAEKWGYLPDVYKYEPEDAGVTITMGTWHRDKEGLLSNLTALIEEHYYPKKFVEWTMMRGIMGIYDRKGYLYSSALLNLKGFKGDNTIKNLFNYWKENVSSQKTEGGE